MACRPDLRFLLAVAAARGRGPPLSAAPGTDPLADAARALDSGDAIEGLVPDLGVQPEVGAFVVVVGHPGVGASIFLEHQYTTGYVTSADPGSTLDNLGWGRYWEHGYATDAVAWHGNSGGPVFDEDGVWIGILVGAFNGSERNEGPDLSLVIPLL